MNVSSGQNFREKKGRKGSSYNTSIPSCVKEDNCFKSKYLQYVFKYIYLQLETKFNLQRLIFNKHGRPNLVIDNLLQKI